MASLPVGEGWKEGSEEDVSIIKDCYCPNCQGSKAVTTMLPTKIPNFREIIIMALQCDECHFRNSEVSFGGEIQIKGERIRLTVVNAQDLNRQIIKSDSAVLYIPQLDLEFPKRGSISTIEGFLRQAAEHLQESQPDRLKLGDTENFHRCHQVIQQLRRMVQDEQEDDTVDTTPVFPFDIVLDDPAGNSFIENTHAPLSDPNIHSERYFRTPTQDMSLGLQPSQQAVAEGRIDDTVPAHKNPVNAAATSHTLDQTRDRMVGRQEVMKFPTTCAHCYQQCETSMCVTDIPHFKEVIIMSLLCDHCGYKSNEVKGGGAIPKFGTKITLRLNNEDDLAREVLKSDTAGIAIPELELELEEGGIDGLYTTIEGLLNKMHERLRQANPFGSGDAAQKQHLYNDGEAFSDPSPNHARYIAFLEKLKNYADGKLFPFTLVISDPLSNSFVGPVPSDALALALQAEKEGNNKCYDDYVDARMDVDEYERTHEQNEILGLNDMKTEHYGEHNEQNYYGTDAMQKLPDRILHAETRGPDHPHEVGKAPVEGDTTVMGAKSANFAVPAMKQRGKGALGTVESSGVHAASDNLRYILHDFERGDDAFIMNDQYVGSKEGMVYKDGAQGLGYYSNVTLVEQWERYQAKRNTDHV